MAVYRALFFLFSIFREMRSYATMGVEVQYRVVFSVDLQGNTKNIITMVRREFSLMQPNLVQYTRHLV